MEAIELIGLLFEYDGESSATDMRQIMEIKKIVGYMLYIFLKTDYSVSQHVKIT